MSKEAQEIKHLLEELTVIHRNLEKDNTRVRTNIKVLSSKLRKIDRLKLEFNNYKEKFNKEQREPNLIVKVKLIVVEVEKYFAAIYKILNDRINNLNLEPLNPNTDSELDSSDSDISETELEMSEKFSLKTAAGLIPIMNGSETVAKQIIDATELYDSLLDNDGKK